MNDSFKQQLQALLQNMSATDMAWTLGYVQARYEALAGTVLSVSADMALL